MGKSDDTGDARDATPSVEAILHSIPARALGELLQGFGDGTAKRRPLRSSSTVGHEQLIKVYLATLEQEQPSTPVSLAASSLISRGGPIRTPAELNPGAKEAWLAAHALEAPLVRPPSAYDVPGDDESEE